MASVPNELTDYILDFLHGDRRTLKACSLTCRSWYPTSRYHLYRRVYLASPSACKTFLQLLQSNTSRHLGQFTRYLSISKAIAYATDNQPQEDTHVELWSSIFSAVPNVEELHLSFLEIDKTFHAHLGQNLARTTDLTLQYCRFPSFGDFASVLSSFPSLERCTLRGISWESGQVAFARTGAEQRHAKVSIKGLTLGRDLDLQVLVEWLLQEHLCDELESIAACCAFESDAVVLGEFLRASALTLKHVDLDWYCASYSDVRLPLDFTLAGCSSLQTLVLRCPIALQSKVPWVSAVLADANAAHVNTITLDVRLLGSLQALDWQRVDDILTQGIYKHLKTVEIKVAVWHTATERTYNIESFIQTQLPKIHSRQMLRFVD